MKTTILLLLISIYSYGQIDTTTVTNENFINLKSLDSYYTCLAMSEDEFKILRFPSKEELKKLEMQKENCKNNRDYKQCEKRIKILEAVINFNVPSI